MRRIETKPITTSIFEKDDCFCSAFARWPRITLNARVLRGSPVPTPDSLIDWELEGADEFETFCSDPFEGRSCSNFHESNSWQIQVIL